MGNWGTDPRRISRRLHQCHGRGWLGDYRTGHDFSGCTRTRRQWHQSTTHPRSQHQCGLDLYPAWAAPVRHDPVALTVRGTGRSGGCAGRCAPACRHLQSGSRCRHGFGADSDADRCGSAAGGGRHSPDTAAALMGTCSDDRSGLLGRVYSNRHGLHSATYPQPGAGPRLSCG